MAIRISTNNLVKKYGNRIVVNHVSIEVKQGEIVGLLGPNGAGKTTTFYQVVGLIKPDEGNVFLNEEDITKLPMFKRAKMGIGYLPQEASIFRKLSVEDNIAAVLEMTDLNRREQKEKLESLMREFRLEHVRKNNGDLLSGGERRRTEIARALAMDPKFILLDEPFAGIDPIAVEDIQSIVAKLKYKNIGILITDHNVTETLSICDRAYLLIEGKIFKHGTAEELAQDDQVRKLYLGRNFELRRKDYLHEEAKETSSVESLTHHYDDSIERRLLYSIQGCSYKTEQFLKYLDNVGIFKMSFATSDTIDPKGYFQFLKEMKQSLFDFAQNSKHQELMEAAYKIPDVEYKRYASMLNLADAAIAAFFVFGVFMKIYLGLIYSSKLKDLENDLRNASSSLGKSESYLHALINQYQ